MYYSPRNVYTTTYNRSYGSNPSRPPSALLHSSHPPWATYYDRRPPTRDNAPVSGDTTGGGGGLAPERSTENRVFARYFPDTTDRYRRLMASADDRAAPSRGGGNSSGGEEEEVTARYGERPHPRRHENDAEYRRGIQPNQPSRSVSASNEERERRRRREEEERRRVSRELLLQKNVLTVLGHDLHLPSNSKQHHTQEYDCVEREATPTLVVRRGQVFMLTFTFQRPWNNVADDFFMLFTLGENPSRQEGSLIILKMDESSAETITPGPNGWAAKIARVHGNQLTLFVYTAPDAIVGAWECFVASRLSSTGELFVYEGVGDICVIFNPWCPDDQVHYSEDPEDLNEYILNEYGCIFRGSPDGMERMSWTYGQFREDILDISMLILRLAFEEHVTKDMGDVITVTRKLSRVLNHSHLDPGVIQGNWSGNYGDGTSPLKWKSSLELLRKFEKNRQPVKYGQCWVFSLVLTTVCRALGIPCRSLTNFESAHDTDKTATIDSFKDEEGDDLPDYKTDSIWNYHCWNDVWIQRPDLDKRHDKVYSGWHALDATPQETSQGQFQCGPTPLTAIKYGECSLGHDTLFLFGEVNGEKCTWMVRGDRSSPHELIFQDPHAVGKAISTKEPDGERAAGMLFGWRAKEKKRLDITHLYKFPEGSEEEREAVKRAVGKGIGSAIFEPKRGVTFEIQKVPETTVGSDFTFTVVVKSTDRDRPRKYKLHMVVVPTDYRGERIGWNRIAYQDHKAGEVPPGENVVHKLPVTDKAYITHCDKSFSMLLVVYGKVEGEDKPISKNRKLVLGAPELAVKLVGRPSAITRASPFMVSIQATNPCSKPLTGCELRITGSIDPVDTERFTDEGGAFVKKITKPIFPNQDTVLQIEVQAQKRPLVNNKRELTVDLVSNELPDMVGSLDIDLTA